MVDIVRRQAIDKLKSLQGLNRRILQRTAAAFFFSAVIPAEREREKSENLCVGGMKHIKG